MQSNVWLTLKWNDCQLVYAFLLNYLLSCLLNGPILRLCSWDPTEYGGLRDMRVPQERVWVPDIVLFNNADGNYEVSYRSNVLVDHDGNVTWVPPAIYKSSCKIGLFFPRPL
jgi:nicotinic acetylcholine receptor